MERLHVGLCRPGLWGRVWGWGGEASDTGSALRWVLFKLPPPPPDKEAKPRPSRWVQVLRVWEFGFSWLRWDEDEEGGQILMSWDSTILASVFFTLRMVRREAGL